MLGVAGFAVALRLGLVLASGASPTLWEYHDIAINLLEGRGWVIDRAGIEYRSYYNYWPYVVATVVAYGGFASGPMAMQCFQALFSGAGVVGVAAVARSVCGSRVALLAAFLVANHPAVVYYDVRNLHPLGFDSSVMVWTTALLLASRVSESLLLAALSGSAIGVSMLERGSPAVLVLLVPVWLLSWGAGRRIGARIGAVLLGFSVIALPMLARNALIHRTPVFSTMTGELLWIGNAPGSSGSNHLESGKTVMSIVPPDLGAAINGARELERNHVLTAAALEIIRADPGAFVARTSRKFVYFWTFAPQTGVTYSAAYKQIYLLYYAAIIGLAAVGLWRWRDAPDLTPALILIGGLFFVVSVTHAVLYFEMRHRWALEPLILIFSAAGVIGPPRQLEPEGG